MDRLAIWVYFFGADEEIAQELRQMSEQQVELL